MKKLKFRKVCDLLNIINNEEVSKRINENQRVEYISDDIDKIKDNSLIFHLNRAKEIDEKKFESLNNCYIVTDQAILKRSIKKDFYLFVKDVEIAYRKVVNYYRSLFNIPIVAITGTCGKTTTKEMITQVLRNKYKVAATISSKNSLSKINDYVLSIDEKTEFGVFETAITHPGHLKYECDVFRPTIGIITTIGIDHLNYCKTLDNYIKTKGEMLVGLDKNGTLIINNDDENIKKLDMDVFKGKIETFGIDNDSDYYAYNIKYEKDGMSFNLKHNFQIFLCYVPGMGRHNVYNALASLAALNNLGMNLNEAIRYLKYFKHIRSHVEFRDGINNSIIIDDTWSSNPTSMEAALSVLNDKGNGREKIAVIGKINYLGKSKTKYYKKIAKMIIKYNVDLLITQDKDASEIGRFVGELGKNREKIFSYDNNNDMYKKLVSILNNNAICLFKCSMLDKSNQEVLAKIIINH